ncbi:MAG: DNA-binding domain-containing protein [Zavarzinia sp.]|nr:DNA-binding domain-containing protein [Zavarzinia sp.]
MRLAEFQGHFAAMLRGAPADPALLALVRGGSVPAGNRLSIHRNHVRTTLTEALALHFPVVVRLVGASAFPVLARRFIDAHPPTDPRLALYGATFPDFLLTVAELAALPMVAEVAALEWARHRAALSPVMPPFDAASFAAMTPETVAALRFRLLPGVSLLRAAHAVDHIWAVNQPGRDGTPSRHVAVETRLVVWRDGGGAIRAADLDPAGLAFLGAIDAAGALGLEPALAAALAATPEADPGHVLARPLGLGLLCLTDDTTLSGDPT